MRVRFSNLMDFSFDGNLELAGVTLADEVLIGSVIKEVP